MQSHYVGYIQRYFPPSQWDNADCITLHEVTDQNPNAVSPTDDWGLFQINRPTWDPDRNPLSPFTREQWAHVLEPNVNVWMAAHIYSRSGWGAWATASLCGVQNVPPGPVPFPNAPIVVQEPPFEVITVPPSGGAAAVSNTSFLTAMGLLIIAGALILEASQEQ